MEPGYRHPFYTGSSEQCPPPLPRRPVPPYNVSEEVAGISPNTIPSYANAQSSSSTRYTGGPPLPFIHQPSHLTPPTLPPRPNSNYSPSISSIQNYENSSPASPALLRSSLATTPISPSGLTPQNSSSAPRAFSPLKTCPKEYPIHFATCWYEIPGLSSIRACSKCFATHISPSVYASHFNAVEEPAGQARLCRFNTPRLLQLWAQAVSSNNFSIIRNFMNSRALVPECPKSSGRSTKWLAPSAGDIQNFEVCEACFIDVIQSTNFSNNFRFLTEHEARERSRICSFSLRFIPRAIQAYSHTATWNEFAAAATQRLSMQACPDKQSILSGKRKWLRPKLHISGLVICETCYFDSAACSNMGLEFEYAQGDYLTWWTCDMALLPLKAAWADAFLAQEFRIWWDAARVAMSSPNCTNGEIRDGLWYTLLQEREGFDICPTCYAGLIYNNITSASFKTRSYAPGTSKMCSFNTGTKRFQEYMLCLNEAVETNQVNVFTDFVNKFSVFDPCPKSDSLYNARWYGTEEYLFCPECYEGYAKGTNIASRFSERNSLLQPGYICSLASPRMRRYWAEACTKNDDREFGRIAKERVQVWIQTIGEAKNIVALTRMRLEQKGTLALAGIGMTGAGNIAAAASGGSHYNYGNSSIGWGYDNSAQAQGATLGQQANSISVVDGGDILLVARLEAAWKDVE